MSHLVEDEALYAAMKGMIQNIYFDLHAIYEPGTHSYKKDWYCAAVDLFNPGMTFKVYFTLDKDGQIHVEEVSRWLFG